MRRENRLNERGITLIELLVALVICGVVVAGIYRVFIAQTRAYTVQDQVVEVQQNVRSAMEILLRDLRMAGYDSNDINSKITISTPITIVGTNEVTVNYEYDNTTQYTVRYWRDGGSQTLWRRLTITKDDGTQPAGPPAGDEMLLENVEELSFVATVAEVHGTNRVVAVLVTLSARPIEVNPDLKMMVSPRTLESTVALRNQLF